VLISIFIPHLEHIMVRNKIKILSNSLLNFSRLLVLVEVFSLLLFFLPLLTHLLFFQLD